jgi:hypothetical protein
MYVMMLAENIFFQSSFAKVQGKKKAKKGYIILTCAQLCSMSNIIHQISKIRRKMGNVHFSVRDASDMI